MTVRTEVRIQEVARTDSRGGSHDIVALSSAQHLTPHRTDVNESEGHKSNQTEANDYLSLPRRGTPVMVVTKHNCI